MRLQLCHHSPPPQNIQQREVESVSGAVTPLPCSRGFIISSVLCQMWKRVKCSPVQLWHTWVEEPDCFGQIFRRSSFWPIKRNMLPLITHQPSLPYESCGDLEQLLWPWWWAEWKSEWDEGSRPQPKSHKAMDTFRTTLSPPSTDT